MASQAEATTASSTAACSLSCKIELIALAMYAVTHRQTAG